MTNETKNNDLGDRLKQIILNCGVEKKMFAKKCGISPNQLHNYLNGSQEPGSKFYRGLKNKYPDVSIDWLMSGDGRPYLKKDGDQKNETSMLDLQHDRVIRQFDDKKFALEISQALMAMEKASLKEFYKLGGYIKALSESGIEMRTEPGHSQNQQNDSDVWDGTERRSGNDRRKTVGKTDPSLK
jgi:transcriptional regulator with XRE-family HTH domain